MQEELKRRESRWSAASTRSRQRIEALEQEKGELQDEVKLLEKYRLQHWREEELAKVRLILVSLVLAPIKLQDFSPGRERIKKGNIQVKYTAMDGVVRSF